MPAIIASALISFAIFADEEMGKKGAPDNKIAPEVLDLVRKYSEFIKTKSKGKVDIVVTANIIVEGLKQEIKFESFLVFEKPNKVSFTTKGTMAGGGIVSDGSKMYSYLDVAKKYTEKDAPESLDAVPFRTTDQDLPIAELIVASDPEKQIMEGVISAVMLGREKIGEFETVRVKFEQSDFDWEFWFRTGE